MSPQLENGYTKIANEVLDNIAKAKLNGTQFRILMVVWRSTYGWDKKEFKLSESFLANATGIHKQQIKRELKEMLKLGLLVEVEKPTFNTSRVIGFNKRYQESIEVAKKIPVSEIDTSTGSELDTPTGSELDTQKRNTNKTIKRNIYEGVSDKLKESILEFVEFRKEIKKPIYDIGISKLILKLAKMSDNDETKILILEQSILNNWQGVFELKEQKTKQATFSPKEDQFVLAADRVKANVVMYNPFVGGGK